MSEFLGIDIKTLDYGGFQFCQTGLIRKVLEATGMEHCNGLPTSTKVEEPLGTDVNGSETKRDLPNSYASIIGMMLYLASNTRPDISFDFHQCARFTNNTKASHKTAMKRICRYLPGTKDNGLFFYPFKKLVMEFYADADFAGLWGHENSQEPICTRSRTGFVVNFANCPLFLVSTLQTDISLSTLNSEYVSLSHSVRALLPLKSIIKEESDNLGIDSEKLKFVSSSIIYEDNTGAVVVATIPRMTPKSKRIFFKYHWFRKHIGKTFVIRKIESENKRAYIFTKGLQGEIFVSIRKLLCGW